MIGLDVVVMVPGLPSSVPQLHHADSALEQTSGDERLPAVHGVTVHGPDGGRFAGQIEGVAGFHLHAEGQLERFDARLQSRIRSVVVPVGGIERGQKIQLPALHARGGVRAADILDEPLHVAVLRIDERSLEHAGQEGRLPVLGVLDGQAAGAQRDEARQVLVLGTEPIQRPGSEAGPWLHAVAAIHEHERRLVIGHLRVHGADDGDVVGMGGGAGEEFADF